jgi:hypothetical protein
VLMGSPSASLHVALTLGVRLNNHKLSRSLRFRAPEEALAVVLEFL